MSKFENPTKTVPYEADLEHFVNVPFDESGLIERYGLPDKFIKHHYMSVVNVRKNGKND